MFSDTTLDLTFSKRLPNSPIEDEFLDNVNGLNFKKVCIFSGANASGKTALSKMMCNINNYIKGSDLAHEKVNIADTFYDSDKTAKFTVDFVTPNDRMFHSLSVEFDSEGILKEKYNCFKMRTQESYSSLINRLKNNESAHRKKVFNYNRKAKKENFGIVEPGFSSVAHSKGVFNIRMQWYYSFCENDQKSILGAGAYRSDLDIRLMNTILKSFDISIIEINRITESKNKSNFIVKFSNGDEAFIIDDDVENKNRFSRGTIEALELVAFIQRVIEAKSGTYFLDEKMAYSHSEIEQAILTLIISQLGRYSQFFYTTHNYDILDLNLPSHSFAFLKKEKFTTIIHPEKLGYTKNDRGLLSYVKDDVFSTLPDVDKIYEWLQ